MREFAQITVRLMAGGRAHLSKETAAAVLVLLLLLALLLLALFPVPVGGRNERKIATSGFDGPVQAAPRLIETVPDVKTSYRLRKVKCAGLGQDSSRFSCYVAANR